jgi:hypothetical protein
MGGGEGVEDLFGVGDALFGGDRAFELLAFDEFHDEVVGTDVVELADVGVI